MGSMTTEATPPADTEAVPRVPPPRNVLPAPLAATVAVLYDPFTYSCPALSPRLNTKTWPEIHPSRFLEMLATLH